MNTRSTALLFIERVLSTTGTKMHRPIPIRSRMVASGGIAAVLLLAGCTAPTTVEPTPAIPAFAHIHELAADPNDGSLTVATHEGLFRLTVRPGGAASIEGPLGGLDFDPMGYTIADGIAYASGHPGPTTPESFGRPNLGLITSGDGSQTWNNVSLTGTTDFHALTVDPSGAQPEKVYGYDATESRLQRSTDGGVTWTAGAELEARDILADGNRLYATTPDGLAVSDDDGATFILDPAAPKLLLLAADHDGSIVGVDTTGTIWTQLPGQDWTHHPTVDGTLQAVAIQDSRIWVADDRGIVYTDDFGKTWTAVTLAAAGAEAPEASRSVGS